MNYCHECGSEIAELDTFCPFCGISLTSAAVPEKAELPEDKTIAVSREELSEIFEPRETPENESPEPEEIVAETDSADLSAANETPEIPAAIDDGEVSDATDEQPPLASADAEDFPAEIENKESESSDEISTAAENRTVEDIQTETGEISDSQPADLSVPDEAATADDLTLMDYPTPQILQTEAEAMKAEPETEIADQISGVQKECHRNARKSG